MPVTAVIALLPFLQCVETEELQCQEKSSKNNNSTGFPSPSLSYIVPHSQPMQVDSTTLKHSFFTTSSLTSLKAVTVPTRTHYNSLSSSIDIVSSSGASTTTNVGSQNSVTPTEIVPSSKESVEPRISSGKSESFYTSTVSLSIFALMVSSGTSSPIPGHQQDGFSIVSLNNTLALTVIGLLVLCIVLTCILILMCGHDFIQKTKLWMKGELYRYTIISSI